MPTIDSTPSVLRSRIDSGKVSPAQYGVFILCFLLNALDGFDIVVMSAVAPVVTDAWGLEPFHRGWILGAALAGMTMGAIFIAPLCDKYGRSRMMLLAVICTGVGMLATSMVDGSLWLLIFLRVLTGLGIGVIMAGTTVLATEYAPEKLKNLIVPIVIVGYPFGAMAVGPIANFMITDFGWQSIFLLGGVVTIALGVAIFFFLPESIFYLEISTRPDDQRGLDRINKLLASIRQAPISELPGVSVEKTVFSVAHILTPEYRWTTIRIWLIFFAGLLNMYFLFTWIPSLYIQSGFSKAQGNDALTFFNIGGVFGILAIAFITSRIKLRPALLLFFSVATALMFYFALSDMGGITKAGILILAIGFFFQGGYTGMYTIAARSYPTFLRATGVGWALGLGRSGAILAPIIAGYLVSAGWSMSSLFLLFAVPVLLMAIIVSSLRHL